MSRTKGARTIREPERSRIREAVARDYEAGYTIVAAAARNRIAYATAYRFLLEAKIDRRRPHESRRTEAAEAAAAR